MGNIEESRQNAIELLNELDEDDTFTLITRSPDEEDSTGMIQAYTADQHNQIDHLNKVATYMLLMNSEFEDYSLDEIARDCLKAARLQAQGGEVSR